MTEQEYLLQRDVDRKFEFLISIVWSVKPCCPKIGRILAVGTLNHGHREG